MWIQYAMAHDLLSYVDQISPILGDFSLIFIQNGYLMASLFKDEVWG